MDLRNFFTRVESKGMQRLTDNRVWPNYGLGGGTDGTGRGGKRKAAVVLVLLAKDVVSLQINTEIGKS